jgi:hypothetical protein
MVAVFSVYFRTRLDSLLADPGGIIEPLSFLIRPAFNVDIHIKP